MWTVFADVLVYRELRRSQSQELKVEPSCRCRSVMTTRASVLCQFPEKFDPFLPFTVTYTFLATNEIVADVHHPKHGHFVCSDAMPMDEWEDRVVDRRRSYGGEPCPCPRCTLSRVNRQLVLTV
jgi:hypothetical protein